MYLALKVLKTSDIDVIITPKMFDCKKVVGICMVFETEKDAYDFFGEETILVSLETEPVPQQS